MTLNAAQITQQLSSSATAAANLSVSCQGILRRICKLLSPGMPTSIASCNRPSRWQESGAPVSRARLQTDVLACVIHCGQAFGERRATITNLFNSTSGDFGSGWGPLSQN